MKTWEHLKINCFRTYPRINRREGGTVFRAGARREDDGVVAEALRRGRATQSFDKLRMVSEGLRLRSGQVLSPPKDEVEPPQAEKLSSLPRRDFWIGSNNKAQTVTELAGFGSILLLVVSFLVSYGLRYNFQQDVQLRAFRMAMDDAYNNVTRPDAASTITLIEDKHVPDPRDRFGVGSVVPAQGRAQIVWGNTMNDPYVDTSDNSQIKYVINGEERAYTIEGFEIIDSSNAPGGFYVDFLNERRLVSWDTVTCYWPGNDPNKPKLVRIPVGQYKWELISSIYLRDSGGNAIAQSLPIISVVPSGAQNGDPITGFGVKSPRRGEINPYYAQQLNQDTGENNGSTPKLVTPENMQGLLIETNSAVARSGSLRLRETSSQWSSTESFNMNTGVTRKIRKNGGEDTITSTITTSVSGRTMTVPK